MEKTRAEQSLRSVLSDLENLVYGPYLREENMK